MLTRQIFFLIDKNLLKTGRGENCITKIVLQTLSMVYCVGKIISDYSHLRKKPIWPSLRPCCMRLWIHYDSFYDSKRFFLLLLLSWFKSFIASNLLYRIIDRSSNNSFELWFGCINLNHDCMLRKFTKISRNKIVYNKYGFRSRLSILFHLKVNKQLSD